MTQPLLVSNRDLNILEQVILPVLDGGFTCLT